MSNLVLQTYNLSKQYGPIAAVDAVNLRVPRGIVSGFLGPNGAGKTTTIGMLLGLLHPTAGRIELFGEPVTPQQTGVLRRVGALVGTPGMVPHMSGRANLRLLTYLYPDVDDRRVEEVLDLVDLTHAADRPFRSYSTGMRQRLGLGAALLHRPDLLVLDEPTNGLDPAGMRAMRELLRALAADGITVFLSSHLLHEIEQVCDQITVLSRGKVVAQGTVAELLGEHQVVRVWLPAPQAAVPVLQALPGVRTIQPNGNYVDVAGISSEAVIKHLVMNDLVPSEVTYGRGDLEDIFFELTADKAA